MREDLVQSDVDASYDALASEEADGTQRLDNTYFKMGDWLVEIQASVDDIRALAKRYPVGHRLYRAEGTLAARKNLAELIPPDRRNSSLSWTAHAEAARIRDRDARFSLIANPPEASDPDAWVTAQDMAASVLKVRRDLGEVRKPRRAADMPAKRLQSGQGLTISDGEVVVKVYARVENGKVSITTDNSSPAISPPDVTQFGQGRKSMIEYELGED